MILKKLISLLQEMNKNKNDDFEGLGLIVYSSIDGLPISPINQNTSMLNLPILSYDNIIQTLREVSTAKSPFHDGFHLISENFELTDLCQYFSTPIVNEILIENQFGSRYRTALYGSLIPNVLYTAVLSKNYGPFIFDKGKVITIINN